MKWRLCSIFSLVLLISVSASPVIVGQKTEKKEIAIEIHTLTEIKKEVQQLSEQDYMAVISNLEKAITTFHSKYHTQPYAPTSNGSIILETLLGELYQRNIISSSVYSELSSNLFLLFFGYGTEMARMSLPFFLIYLMYKINTKFFERVTLLDTVFKNLLRFSLCRSRLMIPFSICAVWGKLEIFTFGLREPQYITRSGKWKNQPDFLTLLGFTGLWISVESPAQATNSWFIGSSLRIG